MGDLFALQMCDGMSGTAILFYFVFILYGAS